MKESEDIRGLRLTLIVYLLIFVMKLVAYFFSGILALLAEALHTLSDIFVSGFLLLATVYSRKRADRTHMFGHGRAQNIAALVASVLFISFTSFELYREAIPRLFQHEIPEYQNFTLAIAVLVVSMLIAAFPLIKLYRQTRGAKSTPVSNRIGEKPSPSTNNQHDRVVTGEGGAAAKAQFMELINDELGLLAALVGTLFVSWGKPLADPLAAIFVASIIAFNAIKLFKENGSILLGSSPGAKTLAEVERLALSVPGVLDVHSLRLETTGPNDVHADMHIVVQRGIPIEQAEEIAEDVRRKLYKETIVSYCIVHVDPTKEA
jgi:cation diffusion facilitator family transporter